MALPAVLRYDPDWHERVSRSPRFAPAFDPLGRLDSYYWNVHGALSPYCLPMNDSGVYFPPTEGHLENVD